MVHRGRQERGAPGAWGLAPGKHGVGFRGLRGYVGRAGPASIWPASTRGGSWRASSTACTTLVPSLQDLFQPGAHGGDADAAAVEGVGGNHLPCFRQAVRLQAHAGRGGQISLQMATQRLSSRAGRRLLHHRFPICCSQAQRESGQRQWWEGVGSKLQRLVVNPPAGRTCRRRSRLPPWSGRVP